MICFVSFRTPVTLGSHGRESWSLKNEQAAGANQGRTTVEDKQSYLLFTYTAGDVKQRIRVPLGNIGFITEMDEPAKEKGK